MTRHRSLFIKRSPPYFLLGSSKYIGLVSYLIVGFSYKPSINSFFVYDFIFAIDCNQLLLVFFGGKTKRSCFDPFIHWLIKQITNTYRNDFSFLTDELQHLVRPSEFRFKWKYIQITLWWGRHFKFWITGSSRRPRL